MGRDKGERREKDDHDTFIEGSKDLGQGTWKVTKGLAKISWVGAKAAGKGALWLGEKTLKATENMMKDKSTKGHRKRKKR